MKYTHLWEEVEHDERMYDVAFSIDFTVTPFTPAKINCDPDDGHPAEGGEVNINDVEVLFIEMCDVGKLERISPAEKLYWTERFTEQIDADFEMELSEYAAQQDEEARQTEEDARYDTMREERDGS